MDKGNYTAAIANCKRALQVDGNSSAAGLEPAASCVTGRRSNQLNYAPAY
jgi:hypothetical protein